MVSKVPNLLGTGPSAIEGGCPALFISSKLSLPTHECYKKAPYEAAHMHEADWSIHCILPVADARLVVQKGWGERHGLSGKIGFPRGYLMGYALRSESEVGMIETIVVAAARYGMVGWQLAEE
ncbi:hypothetical protein K458DRAFT_364257 [Lentithecium fluviatile CBS 122367]|uniref:Luciferase domain-containing protein n=1 Tax=Lentithecium fluviatile CBS 122367 TaxID=1168545 RepID=A0A6G1J887_9PLEO|nr:hypothetical protein K458DRAFT_364257 [Lentithecium fluviatile CBS 122367]